MKIEKIKYPSINGLRAVSIILVLIHHLNISEHVFEKVEEFKWLIPLIDFLKDGHLGVNIFFVISGFLITALMQQEEKQNNSISLKSFYLRRVLRIFPAFYFLLIVYAILHIAGIIYISNLSWVTAITYTKYFNWQLDWYTAHIWSLSVEEHFYIFWPIIFMFGADFRKILAFALIIIVPIIRVYVNFYPISWINELTIFTRIDSIAMGCLFALYKNEIVQIINSHWNKFFYASCFFLFFLRYIPILASKVNLDFVFIPLGLTHGTIANFLIGIIMMYSVFGPKEMWFKFLNLKLVNYIGLLSYSIYLWQQIFINRSSYWATKFPQNIVFVFVMAMFSYHLIEKYFLKLKSQLLIAKNNN